MSASMPVTYGAVSQNSNGSVAFGIFSTTGPETLYAHPRLILDGVFGRRWRFGRLKRRISLRRELSPSWPLLPDSSAMHSFRVSGADGSRCRLFSLTAARNARSFA